jgi:hypothetical protein
MNDAYSARIRRLGVIAALFGLLMSSCSGAASGDKHPTGASERHLRGTRRVAIQAESNPAGTRFYFQYCGMGEPAHVGQYIVVDEVLADGSLQPICSVKSIGLRCRGAVWQYGETPEGWEQVRSCAPLRPGTTYRISADGSGNQQFNVEDGGTVRLLDGLCAFDPTGGPSTDAERQRYGWACK